MDEGKSIKRMNHGLREEIVVQIVTHNNEKTISDCLSALLRQRGVRFRVIVIDNASTDATTRILRTHAVHVIANKRNMGYAAGHNQALRLSGAPHIMTLNPDVVLAAGCLSRVVTRLNRLSSFVGSVQIRLLRVQRMGDRSTLVDSAGLVMNAYRRQNLRYTGRTLGAVPEGPAYIFGPDGAAAVYRRAMLADIDLGHGVFDEDFFMHKEDVDVCWRAQLRGWTSVFLPDAVGYHIRTFRPGQRSRIDARMRMLALRNRYYLIIKNDLLPLFFRDLPWIALYDFGILLYALLLERASLSAYSDALKHFPDMLAKRRRIQASRRVGLSYMAQWFRWGSA